MTRFGVPACVRASTVGGPDVRRPIAIDVAPAGDAVGAIHRLGDHATSDSRGFRVFRLPSSVFRRQFLGLRLRRERDRLPVRRPRGVPGAAGNVGDRACFAAGHRHHVDLRRLRTAVLFDRTHEGEPAAVRRPARRCVAAAAGQTAAAARCRQSSRSRSPCRTDPPFRRRSRGRRPPAIRPARSADRRPRRT